MSHQTEVYFKPGRKSNQQGFIRDLSESGSFLVAYERLYEGVEVILYVPIEYREKKNLCMLHGKIVRIEKKDGVDAYGYGIRFTGVSPGTQIMLKNFLANRLKAEFGIQAKSTPHTAAA